MDDLEVALFQETSISHTFRHVASSIPWPPPSPHPATSRSRWFCRCFQSTVPKWPGPRGAASRWPWRCLGPLMMGKRRGKPGKVHVGQGAFTKGEVYNCRKSTSWIFCVEPFYLSISRFFRSCDMRMGSSDGLEYITKNHGGRSDNHGAIENWGILVMSQKGWNPDLPLFWEASQ